MNKVLEVLKAARERISDPSRWTTTFMARDCRGLPTSSAAQQAACWCAVGAILVEAHNHDFDYPLVIKTLEMTTGDLTIYEFNDQRGHQAVLDLFDRTIAAESSKQESI